MIGFDLNYDAFMGLTFGFFVACVTVRLKSELGNGLAELRLRRHGQSDRSSAELAKAGERLRREFAE